MTKAFRQSYLRNQPGQYLEKSLGSLDQETTDYSNLLGHIEKVVKKHFTSIILKNNSKAMFSTSSKLVPQISAEPLESFLNTYLDLNKPDTGTVGFNLAVAQNHFTLPNDFKNTFLVWYPDL